MEIRLIIAINCISSKDTDKERIMHSRSHNIEFTIYEKADEVMNSLNKLFIDNKFGCKHQ